MKKFLIFAMIMLMASPCFAVQLKLQAGTGLAVTGPVKAQSIMISAPTSGDAATIFDATSAADISGTGFELAIGANTSNSPSWNCADVPFQNGIYIMATDSDVVVAITYY